jgi:small multidrug resistance pump
MSWLYLAAAICFEVIGSMTLRASGGKFHRRWTPTVVIAYTLSFGSLSLALRAHMPIAVAYSVWTALGVVVTAFLAHRLFGEPLSRRLGLGIGLIAIGATVVQIGLHRN